MSPRWYVRMVLSAVIGLGVVAGLARAEPPQPNPEPWAVIEYGRYSPGVPTVETAPPVVQAPSRKPLRRFLDWYREHSWTCRTHHDDFGCSSWESECVFIFGSCRQFFGEPCRKGPSPYPSLHERMNGGGCSRCP